MPCVRSVLALVIAATLGISAHAAQWKQLAKNPQGELWIDNASIKRDNGQAVFDYRIDYTAPQQEAGSSTQYRSTVTRAAVRCTPRTLAMGSTIAYAGAHGTGKQVGRYPPSPEEARFQPVERGSSDENLWHHVCSVAQLSPQR